MERVFAYGKMEDPGSRPAYVTADSCETLSIYPRWASLFSLVKFRSCVYNLWGPFQLSDLEKKSLT
jgi:hypothetical protein